MKNEPIQIPSSLLYKNEVELIKTLPHKRTQSTVLNCSVYTVNEENFDKVMALSDNGSRALAIRIVAKALSIKRSSAEVRASLLAVASGLGGWCPQEADRILRSI